MERDRLRDLFLVPCLTLGLNAWADVTPLAQAFDPSGLIPLDPATQSYTIDNRELRFKEHLALPGNSSFKNGGMIDDRYRLTNLIADEHGTYERAAIKKIVVVDTHTGEVRQTAYEGTIACLVDGNLATHAQTGKVEDWTFSYGKYGETLQTWRGVAEPDGMYLNQMSCTLQPRTELKMDAPPEQYRVIPLRSVHGQLLTGTGQPLPGNTPGLSPEVQRLMQHPFMRNMTLPAHSEQWILRKPDGQQVTIPHNSSEAAIYGSVSYLPYMNAYFIEARARPMLPREMWSIPRFYRLLFPDGRVVRYGFPDVIWQAGLRSEIGARAMYTKAGLVWRIEFVRIDRTGRTKYKGELKEGYYLDQPDKKTLTKIPDLLAHSQADLMPPYNISNDGCQVKTRREVTQKKPHILFNVYYINLCTGE